MAEGVVEGGAEEGELPPDVEPKGQKGINKFNYFVATDCKPFSLPSAASPLNWSSEVLSFFQPLQGGLVKLATIPSQLYEGNDEADKAKMKPHAN